MSAKIIVADVMAGLRSLPDASARCCVTSPPYWGLRDYGVPGQIGLEATPDEFVARMVEVFSEVRRVLTDDGTLWLNLGDSYAGSWGAQSRPNGNDVKLNLQGGSPLSARQIAAQPKGIGTGSMKKTPGLKPKDLCGIPWRVAFALQADGWWLRSDIIWHKPNPMPESTTDRPTKSHEYLFLLTKSARYYYDAEAIAEPCGWDPENTKQPDGWDTGPGGHGSFHRDGRQAGKVVRSGNKERKPASARGVPVDTNGESNGAVAGSVPWEGVTRNKRTVWTVATKPFAEAHFATFPPDLIEPCVLAGSAEGDTVLDPFSGAGTTALVANRRGRSFVGVELNPEYAEIARNRLVGDSPMFHGLTVEIGT